MKNKFLAKITDYQFQIDREIKLFFEKEINKESSVFFRGTLKLLEEFSLRPAKRIRAILINSGYFLAGGKDRNEILKTSVFIEFIHNFLLAHDDIIDRDKMRRGKKTLHYGYQAYSPNNAEKEHYGQSMAIVAGDIMEFLGREILAQSKIRSDFKIKADKKLNEVLVKTAFGEMFEFWLRGRFAQGKKIGEKDILNVYRTKTALYTFVGPMQIGAILAGADTKLLSVLEKIGINLGIAFQIKDDIEEIFCDKKELGSDPCSDIREGQPNILILKTIKTKKSKNVRKYLGKKIGVRGLNIIRDEIIKSGAYNECRLIAEKLIGQAKKDINSAKFPKKEKEFMLNLADYISVKSIRF